MVTCTIALTNGFKPEILFTSLAIAALVSSVSFTSIHQAATGTHVRIVNSIYASFFTLVGMSSIFLFVALRKISL
jgi:hypothetical protein